MIRASSVEMFRSAADDEANLFIHALGFERRSSAILKSKIFPIAKPISLVFPNETRMSFNTNLALARERGSELIDDYSRFFRSEFYAKVRRLNLELGKKIRIVVDVSSMNRTMIATVLFSVVNLRQHLDSVSLIYVPGEFNEPKVEFPAIEQIGAVIPELSGFSANPELPIGVLMGLGYEYGLAVGLINRLEPSLTVCFRALGYDVRYDEACRKANLDFEFGYNNIEVDTYPLLEPASAYRYIENVIFGMTKNFRVVIVPLGPKIFAALATLIAIKNIGAVAIWRVAAKIRIVDVAPCDEFIKLELDLETPVSESEMQRAVALRQ